MLKIGDYEVTLLREGTVAVDGGSLFGPVPRVIWERHLRPDANNRVTLELRCLLVKGPGFNLLIDAGFGNKTNDKARNSSFFKRETTMEAHLAQSGLKPEDITHVIFTHLHVDHAGGATCYTPEDDEVIPTFPKAEYFVQEGEWRDACSPGDFERNSYGFENVLPLLDSGRLRLINGDQEIIRGVKVMVTGGHTKFHQSVRIESRGNKLHYPGDIFPTSFHLPLTWRTSRDLYPMILLESRQKFLTTLMNTDAITVFPHDPKNTFIKLGGSLEKPSIIPINES